MEKKTHLYHVEMTCEGCSGAVEKVLNKLKGNGVENVEINLKDKTVKVLSTMSSDEILNIIKKTGKSVEYVSSS